MWQRLAPYRAYILVGALLLCPLILLYAQTRSPNARGPVVGVFVDAAGVIERGMLFVTGGVADLYFTYVYNIDAQKDLAEARIAASKAVQLKSERNELAAENEILRDLASVAQRLDGPRPVGARVIGRTGAPLTRILRIDRGRSDGVHLGDAVLGAEGAIGQIIALGRWTSDVLLLTDPGAAIDVVVQRTRVAGIVSGIGDDEAYKAHVPNFSRHSDVVVGDVLVTSGIAAPFVPGTLVGTVTETHVGDDNLHIAAKIQPATDMAKVEYVLVLVKRERKRTQIIAEQEPGPDAGPASDGGAAQ